MTKIKRYISVLILASFTVMLLAGCGSPMVTNNSSTMISKYSLDALEDCIITESEPLGEKTLQYARYVAGFSSDAGEMLKDSEIAFNINNFGSIATNYWFESSDLTEVVTILKTLNEWVKNGYGTVRFIVYQAVTASGDVTYVGAVSITPFHSRCRCTDVDDEDSYCANCVANGCDFGEFCTCNG